MRRFLRTFLFIFLAIPCATAAIAAAHIDPLLAQRLALGLGPHQVVVTFERTAQADALAGLGVAFVPLRELPMAGALLTSAQVRIVERWPEVRSIYFNAPLEYSNYTSGEITGGHWVHDTRGVRGAGVTIAVLDSGIDATHPDLAFGSRTVQNVKLLGDLGSIGLSAYIENVPNTDTTSGHGTHVAGTAGGSGAASAADERRAAYFDGIAPDAALIGLGAGEGLSIFHALLGFEWVLANQQRYGIDIVTNSWGGGDGAAFDPSNPINRASYECYRRGMVVTFAASNSGPDEDTLNQYAIAPWVINVAAGTASKGLADFSSRGVPGDPLKHPDITAPGESITSTRAPGTVIGALGPVIDPNHPEYTLRYHTISGTSMATPFVAGSAALLLSVNPQLSPDQIEQILRATADPMPGYVLHQVGAGYIDVREAVEVTAVTGGTRVAFLAGDTRWSSQGEWNVIADADTRLGYFGRWRTRSSSAATDGAYRETHAHFGGVLRAQATGPAFKLTFPVSPRGGVADVFVDGVKRDTVSFYSASAGWGSAPVTGLGEGSHLIELRATRGEAYFDGLLLEGQLFAVGTELIEEARTFSGTMGPSVADLEIDRYPLEVDADTVSISGRLAWTGLLDLDLYLVDPQGARVVSAATLANPEAFVFTVSEPGEYVLEVTGYATVAAAYTLDVVVTRAVPSQ